MKARVWQILLKVKKELASFEGTLSFCHFSLEGGIAFNELLSSHAETDQVIVLFDPSQNVILNNAAVFFIKNKFHLELLKPGNISDTIIKFLEAYLPYCFLSLYARKAQRAITVAHFAQTLDGRIATTNGHSKWIGNQENLIHAHRMRALCDAVLIGNKTLKYDRPRLTVRLVPGETPVRVILGTTNTDYSSLQESSSKKIIVIGSPKVKVIAPVEYLKLPEENGQIPCCTVLEHLFLKGIHSVYLEGGPTTTSNFIADSAIDIIQLHFSPLIFGSGRSAIVLPEIEKVSHGIQFNHFQFQPVGDSIMFVGLLNQS